MNDYLDELNESQRAAVLYNDGPSLVIAGAGSGKTRVLTYKIAHLMNIGYDPWNILALTFTNKAANELKDRLETMLGPQAQDVWAMTFHSACCRILRQDIERLGYSRSFTIYDTADSERVIKDILKEMSLDEKVFAPRMCLTQISRAKDQGQWPEDFTGTADLSGDYRMERLGRGK